MTENRNRYPGINPHLNSALQQADWKGFHNTHLVHLMDAIVPILPQGYYIKLEDSLQLSARNTREYSVADLAIRKQTTYPSSVSSTATAELEELDTPTLTLDVFEQEDFVPSPTIYKDEQPITHIELRSPANMPSGSHHSEYLKKREETLRAGLRLVEIDYLHERRPVLDRLPSYPDRDVRATPYTIVVSDPRQPVDGMKVYGFGVLDHLPKIPVPLDGVDFVKVDFGAVYQHTFNTNPYFYEILTNYTSTPLNFQTYAPDDQALILQHMAAIAKDVPQ